MRFSAQKNLFHRIKKKCEEFVDNTAPKSLALRSQLQPARKSRSIARRDPTRDNPAVWYSFIAGALSESTARHKRLNPACSVADIA